MPKKHARGGRWGDFTRSNPATVAIQLRATIPAPAGAAAVGSRCRAAADPCSRRLVTASAVSCKSAVPWRVPPDGGSGRRSICVCLGTPGRRRLAHRREKCGRGRGQSEVRHEGTVGRQPTPATDCRRVPKLKWAKPAANGQLNRRIETRVPVARRWQVGESGLLPLAAYPLSRKRLF